MSGNLEGRVAIITGGGGEQGGETCRVLAARGAKIGVADINLEAAERTVEDLRAAGHEGVAIQVDVAEEDAVKAMAAKTLEAYGRIDIMYANAAALGLEMQQRDLDVATMSVEIWDKAMAVNLRGPMLCTKHVLPSMLEQGGGSVIYASSGLAFQGELSRSAYSASKQGLMILAKSVATQYGRKGVRANAIQIGFVPPIRGSKPTLPAVVELLGQHNLVPEILKPVDIANVVAFLASDDAYAVTGHTIVADGGFSAHTPTMRDLMQLMETSQIKEI